MSSKKYKEIRKLDDKAREEKLRELRLGLIKKNITANKASKGKAKEIKKAIARILALKTQTQKT